MRNSPKCSFGSWVTLSIFAICTPSAIWRTQAKSPRPRLRIQGRVFWTLPHRFWPAWRNALIIFKPETVVAWHQVGFCLFWRLRSRQKNHGRARIDVEIRALIQQMMNENRSSGASRIHGELLKLGFNVSEHSVSRSGSPRSSGRRFCAITARSLPPRTFSPRQSYG